MNNIVPKKHKPIILVVDDLHVNIRILAEVLDRERYSISFATSGKQTLKTAHKIKPDLILLDIVMPDLNGIYVCRQLKKDKETRDIPVIFISGQKTNFDDIIKGFQAGAADYVTKPFNPAELNARVNTHLDLKLRTEKLREKEKALKKANDELELRTAELEKINQQLRRENEERIRTEKELLLHQAKLRTMTAELVIAEEQERRRAAVEIHESIGQLLAVINIRLGAIKHSAISSDLTDKLEEILKYIEQTIHDMRSVSYKLSPPILYEMGLEAAIAGFIDKIQEKYNLHIDFIDDNQLKYLENPSRIHLFRSVRELIFNIIRHANAQNVKITACRNRNEIQITVEDDGKGFDSSLLNFPPDLKDGFGLFSIRERIIHLGGHFEIHSKPGQGTWVFLSSPLGEKKEI